MRVSLQGSLSLLGFSQSFSEYDVLYKGGHTLVLLVE